MAFLHQPDLLCTKLNPRQNSDTAIIRGVKLSLLLFLYLIAFDERVLLIFS